MTLPRALGWYLAAGILVLALLGTAVGGRGIIAVVAAWLVGLPPLILPIRPWRVAAGRPDPKISVSRKLLQPGDMLFRLAWTLGAVPESTFDSAPTSG